MSWKFIFLVFHVIIAIQAFSSSELEVIRSISHATNRKHLIIVKNLSGSTNYKELLRMLKIFSNKGIYTLFQSAIEMYSTLMELVSYGYPTYKYNPRAIAVINNDELPEMAKLYFNVYYDAVITRIPWISFDISIEKFTEKMNESFIPYDCQFWLVHPSNNTNLDIHEMYKMYPLHTAFRVAYFGSWNNTEDLIVPVIDFYSRRFDFNGTVIGIETSCSLVKEVFQCPFVDVNIFHEIVHSASIIMNFRFYNVYKNHISSYIFSKEYPDSRIEFILDDKYILDSATYFRYFIPMWRCRYYLHVSYNKKYEKGMSAPFIRPFTKKLWFSIGAWILASTAIILFVKYNINRYKKSSKMFDQLIDSCFISFESFTNQCGSSAFLKMESYLITTFITRIPPLFLVLAYSGIIISFITIRIIEFPFQNLEEFIQDGTFKIGYLHASFPKSWFQNTKDPVARLAYEKFFISEEDMPIKPDDGVEKMCIDPKFSFIYLDDFLFEFMFYCQPLQIPTPLFSTNAALRMGEFSHFKNVFTKLINSFRSSGIIHGLRKRVYYVEETTGLLAKNTKDFLRTNRLEIDTVDWDAVESIFILLGILYLTSVAILVLERYIFKKSHQAFTCRRNKSKFSHRFPKLRISGNDLKIENLD